MCDLPQCHISYSDSNLKPTAKEYQWRTGVWSQVSFLLCLLRTNCVLVCVTNIGIVLLLDAKMYVF
jgi:hypothetical protein